MTAPPTMGTEPGELTPDQQAWRIVREALPRWWNTYTREHPNSTLPESQLRELAAHFAVKEALAARIGRPSGEHAELPAIVERLREIADSPNSEPDKIRIMIRAAEAHDARSASVIALQDERIASLERERDEAREWASGWQRIAETTCTVLGLDLIDPDKIVEAVRGKFEAAEARADALSVQVVRKDAALNFYADPDNWIGTPSWDGDPGCFTPKAIPVTRDEGRPCDCGDRARAALTDPAEKTEGAPEQTPAAEDRT